jgi:hypothetical protein
LKALLTCCGLSILLYVLAFGFVLDRPLSLGLLRMEMGQKTARLAALPSAKLVILAGSNGPFSHSCAVIGPMLGMPCENAGIAVGIGLDDLFRRYAPALHAGDVVYMPMEFRQYGITRMENDEAADAGYLLRHDRDVLAELPPDRVLGAVFCCNLNDLLESLVEMPAGFLIRPEVILAGQYNVEGDRIDNMSPGGVVLPNPPGVVMGYGAGLIRRFVADQTARGVIVIGGLPTQYVATPPDAAELVKIGRIYGKFAFLPNKSVYPPKDFYGSADHLSRDCQLAHSIAVARMLAEVLGRGAAAAPVALARQAAACGA